MTQSTDEQHHAAERHTPGSETCSRCRALEARIAELEAAAVAPGAVEPHAAPASATNLPPLEFKALRLLPYGWGEGWQLRPSPPRRHWMDELPHAYKCLPLVMANQWGWQILCPTDVLVTWDGSPSLTGLRVEVAPQYRAGDQEPVRRGDRHVLAPLAVPHPAGLGPVSQGAEQPLEAQLRTRWRASSRPGGSIIRSP